MYLVVNNIKFNVIFLIFLRMENNIGLFVGVICLFVSFFFVKFVNDNVFVFIDWWLFVVVIIWIVFLLYLLGIFIFFWLLEIKFKVFWDVRKVRYLIDFDRLGVFIKEIGDDIGYIEFEICEGCVFFIEDDYEGFEIVEGVCGYFLLSRI